MASVAQLLRLAETRANRRLGSLVDLGSGDGRVVLKLLADKELKSLRSVAGVELNRPLVWWSRLSAWHHGQGGRATFYCRDLWKFPLSSYQTAVVFGVDSMMKPLEEKLLAEMRDDPVIVSCRFPLPNLLLYAQLGSGSDAAYLYLPQPKSSKS